MITLCDIPIDAWVVILRHVNKKKLINTYNKLFISRAINVPLTEKLNTFWMVVSQSRLMDVEEFDTMPDSMKCKNILSNLMKDGVDEKKACEMIRMMNDSSMWFENEL